MSETRPTATEFEDVTVSIVVPYCETYTPQEYLEEALETVDAQVGVDTEVIIVDDDEEQGPAWARNVGLDRAETRYVAFLDADDLWDEAKLLDQLRKLDRTGAGMCVDGEREYSAEEFIGALLTGETFGLTSSILIDTEQVDCRFEESLERREDHLFMIEAASEAGVCFLPDTFEARKPETGLSQHVDSSPEQIENFFEMLVERVPEAEQFRRPYYQNAYVYLGRLRHEDGEYRSAIEHYVTSLKYGPNVQAVGAFVLTVLAMAYQYPLSGLRRVRAGGTP